MKRTTVIISIILVLTMLTVSISPVLAESVTALDESSLGSVSGKISKSLKEKLETLDEDEEIPVWIWYVDINQNEADYLTKKKTGLSAEDCSFVKSSFDITNNVEINSKSEALQKYIKANSKMRSCEKEAVDKYMYTRRKICSELYKEKSERIIHESEIDSDSIIFDSRLSPMIIASLCVEEICALEKQPIIESIALFEEVDSCDSTLDSAISITHIDDISSGTSLNLTGNGIKVGMIEQNRPLFSNEASFGVTLDNPNAPTSYSVSNGVSMLDYGNVVVVGDTIPATIEYDENHNPKVPHANPDYDILKNVAPNIKVYTSNAQFCNIEAMALDDVSLFSVSFAWLYDENSTSYAYTYYDRWFDHLASCHGITTIVAAGNKGYYSSDGYHIDPETNEQTFHYGPRVTSPGMAYNVITVGAYAERSSAQSDPSIDSLQSYSSYQNSLIKDNVSYNGCEKPDIVAPSNLFPGSTGTSYSTPFVAGIVAMMLELKPSLSLYPHEVKAIVLASCQRKVTQTNIQGGQETMTSGIPDRQRSDSQSGITERQGAGVPDAWNMACIICQGSYGSVTLEGTSTTINIEQPSYESENMNVSIAVLKKNLAVNDHEGNEIIVGSSEDIDLSVFHNNALVRKSALYYSSTEMCYFPVSNTDFKYQIKITNMANNNNSVNFGYAWCTDSPVCTSSMQYGAYYIRNVNTNKYLTYNSAGTTGILKLELNTITNQNIFAQNHKWIMDNHTFTTIKAASDTGGVQLGISSTFYDANTKYAKTTSEEEYYYLTKCSDGAYTILYSGGAYVYALSNSNDSVLWKRISSTADITQSEKWYFDKSNYLIGDVFMDGYINYADIIQLESYLGGLTNLNNQQKYLADVNQDGIINYNDIASLYNML